MKIKIFIFLLFTVICISLTDAVEVTDEDINSPLVSYVLAKVQRLESKVMNIRNTRQTTRPPVVAGDNEQCNCPPGLVTYIRWGNSACPYGANTIYSGVVAGSSHKHTGAAVNPLCLPLNPKYLQYQSGYQGYARLYGAEYKTYSPSPLHHSHDRNVPCALCEVTGRTKIMIPSHYECPNGWRREYYGYLMAGQNSHKAATQYTCVDKSLEQISSSAGATNGYLFYTVEAYCGHHIPCSDKEVTCVVCTK